MVAKKYLKLIRRRQTRRTKAKVANKKPHKIIFHYQKYRMQQACIVAVVATSFLLWFSIERNWFIIETTKMTMTEIIDILWDDEIVCCMTSFIFIRHTTLWQFIWSFIEIAWFLVCGSYFHIITLINLSTLRKLILKKVLHYSIIHNNGCDIT